MARKYGRILTSAWSDPEFKSLDPASQVVYFSLISSPDISWCGVAPLLPKRIAGNAKGLTERKVISGFDALSAARFVVIDSATDELAVRTFVRHDEVMRQPNVVKAMAGALAKVHSQQITDCIKDELARDLIDHSDYSGWKTLANTFPELFQEVQARRSPNPLPNPSGNPSRKAS